jgi:hypothetical protein
MIFILVSSLLYGAVMPFAVSSLATPDVEPKHGYLNYRHYLYYLHYPSLPPLPPFNKWFAASGFIILH